MNNTITTNTKMAFNQFPVNVVSQAIFIHDYFLLKLQEYEIAFLSETFIKTPEDEQEYQLPSKEGNWLFYKLIDKEVTSIEENEKNVVVNFNNGWKITVDICLEPPGDNFSMGGPGVIPVFL